MSSGELEDVGRYPAVRVHVVICLAAMATLLLDLLVRGFGSWSLFPPLIGALGVAQRWRSAPLILLVALAGFISIETVVYTTWSRAQPQVPRFRLSDWVLCGAVLAYVISYYRLQGLVGSIFPSDPRRRETQGRRFLFLRLLPRPLERRRTPELASSAETMWLIVSLPIWATLAQVLWLLLPGGDGRLGLSARGEKSLILIWVVAAALAATTAILGYWSLSHATRTEAMLLLQDVDWIENCREQRRIHRWMIWARLRRRRKEKS